MEGLGPIILASGGKVRAEMLARAGILLNPWALRETTSLHVLLCLTNTKF